MVKGDPTTILLVILTEKQRVAIMALKQGSYSHATGPVAGHNTSWINGDPHVLDEYPKDFPFFSYIKRKKEI